MQALEDWGESAPADGGPLLPAVPLTWSFPSNPAAPQSNPPPTSSNTQRQGCWGSFNHFVTDNILTALSTILFQLPSTQLFDSRHTAAAHEHTQLFDTILRFTTPRYDRDTYADDASYPQPSTGWPLTSASLHDKASFQRWQLKPRTETITGQYGVFGSKRSPGPGA